MGFAEAVSHRSMTGYARVYEEVNQARSCSHLFKLLSSMQMTKDYVCLSRTYRFRHFDIVVLISSSALWVVALVLVTAPFSQRSHCFSHPLQMHYTLTSSPQGIVLAVKHSVWTLTCLKLGPY